MRALLLLLTLAVGPQGRALLAVEPEAAMAEPGPGGPEFEEPLVRTFFDLRAGRLDDAYWRISGLARARPDFTLAQLVYGDVLTALSGELRRFGPATSPEVVSELRSEARARLDHYLNAPAPGTVPADLLRVPDHVRSLVLVDVERYRLYLLENRHGVAVPTLDFYASIGKGGIHKRVEGDEKTPVGVYLVDAYLPGDTLPDLYGSGAFPISYPNDWDRLQGRTGSGIWIHGTESERFSRPPRSSRGCVSLSNDHFDVLRDRILVGSTPVIVSDSVEWVSPERVRLEREAIITAIESWRVAWESRRTDRLLAHYARDFRTPELDRETFAAERRRATERKGHIEVYLSELGIYRYPGERDIVVVEFRQDYRSESFRESRRKRQFWRRGADGGWRIVYES